MSSEDENDVITSISKEGMGEWARLHSRESNRILREMLERIKTVECTLRRVESEWEIDKAQRQLAMTLVRFGAGVAAAFWAAGTWFFEKMK